MACQHPYQHCVWRQRPDEKIGNFLTPKKKGSFKKLPFRIFVGIVRGALKEASVD
jgi:hypothetical protein